MNELGQRIGFVCGLAEGWLNGRTDCHNFGMNTSAKFRVR